MVIPMINGHLVTTRMIMMLVVLITAVFATGCSTSVKVEGSLPTPLVKSLPLKMGVYYSPEFRNFTHEEKIFQQGTFSVNMGSQNLQFFQAMLGAMFEQLQEVKDLQLPAENKVGAKVLRVPEHLDGIIVPEILKYGFLTPQLSGLNFFSVSIHYRLRIFDKTGDLASDWVLVGYGKSPNKAFASGSALSEATAQAIRDGGAKIATGTFKQPAVVKWLRSKNISLD